MHTQCPECHTVFRITQAQLDARGGRVRCGRCAAVFRADLHLLEPLSAEHNGAGAGSFETDARGPFHTAEFSPDRESTGERAGISPGADLPTVTELHWARPRVRTRRPFWLLGNLTLLTLLGGQLVYFYRDDVAREPALRPYVIQFCRWIGCEVRVPHDASKIDLAQATVAPHPRYERALRIRATIVNRALHPQPYPSIEVSLTDSAGRVVVRRTFEPHQYRGPDQDPKALLAPNVVADVLLDITSPRSSAVGYEIRLVDPPSAPLRAS